jgi:predicted ArsR family transcriptional regulator
MTLPSHRPDLASLTTLEDPVRRRLYEVVAQRAEPVGREEAAMAAGVGRALASYHLDKLVESGLLTATYRRPPGRSGPGAGRPAKLYARSGREFAVTVPPREYELAARLLAQAIEADPSGRGRAALLAAAGRLGAELGGRLRPSHAQDGPAGREAARDLEGALSGHGYAPEGDDAGVLRLRNCPFHQLAEQHRELVCSMNLALIDGIVAGLGADDLRPALEPQPGYCCVAIRGDRP